MRMTRQLLIDAYGEGNVQDYSRLVREYERLARMGGLKLSQRRLRRLSHNVPMTETTLSIDEAIKLAEAIAIYVELVKDAGDTSPHQSLSNKFTQLVLQIPLGRSTDAEERANILTLSIDENAGIEILSTSNDY